MRAPRALARPARDLQGHTGSSPTGSWPGFSSPGVSVQAHCRAGLPSGPAKLPPASRMTAGPLGTGAVPSQGGGRQSVYLATM